jgi:hypothetical protein
MVAGCAAPPSRLVAHCRSSTQRLLAVAEIIEREQEYGWYFAGDEKLSV